MVFSYNNFLWGLFLNSLEKKDEAEEVVKSMYNIGLVKDDGLVGRKVYKTGLVDTNVYPNFNSLWGLLLNSLGKKNEAGRVIKSMYNINLVRKDGLVSWFVNKEVSERITDINSNDNSLWGLLLRSLGKKDEAEEVVKSMYNINLVREDGLVSWSVNKDGSEKNSFVSSYHNSLLGLLLNPEGYKVFTGDKYA